jgi:GGDEF domain-containing protein
MSMSEPDGRASNGSQPADELQVLDEPIAQQPEIAPERLQQGRKAQRRYHIWMRLSRLALASFIFLGIILALWLLPFSPTGISTSDYTPQMAFTAYLLGGVALVGIFVLFFQELARRNRQILSAWSSVYDEATGMHNRSYFYDRLGLECDRALQTAEPFSVIVLQFHAPSAQSKKSKPPLTTKALEKVAQLINGVTHPSDLVGMLSGSELAVLAARVDRERRHLLQDSVQQVVSTALPDLVVEADSIDVRSGGATFGVDSTSAGGLIQAARTSAAFGKRQRMKVA